jgi:hypothetical protein
VRDHFFIVLGETMNGEKIIRSIDDIEMRKFESSYMV